MPAIAAAFGVFRFACVNEVDFIAPLFRPPRSDRASVVIRQVGAENEPADWGNLIIIASLFAFLHRTPNRDRTSPWQER